ncbi:MAG: alpha/beta fold hydrolase [Acidobacteria bacterium]|nr:MAG: alpha/beta fold hydrolase [Acidobacteriota bacterium]REJ99238.1 MAG: alpha/beta fold hydrolase [Acidobacteriota bacterium]REK16041.1 MAG: alpha/beta fold hydrolase [Acidobacteriota bacterium]REK43722.1 MAG: alpha/beta fold hydrolase [Acidobacteriota bacterium]
MTEVLRTPDKRFSDLPEFTFEPNYTDVGGLRMHYVDEGDKNARPVLLLHGEPTWSFLYRKMIPVITGAGYRAVAPDLIGFGRSDKLSRREDYTYQKHIDWLKELIAKLDLRDAVLFGQDWGGLTGLRIAVEMEDRFSAIAASNTFLPTGDQKTPKAFKLWRKLSQKTPIFLAGKIVQLGTVKKVPKNVRKAYDAPFPSEKYKAGARQFPMLVPTEPDNVESENNRNAWEALRNWEKPFLTAFSDGDPIMRGADRFFQRYVPGAKGQPHTTIKGAGHFIQEDNGEELAAVLVEWLSSL